jgi:hypothetical protein
MRSVVKRPLLFLLTFVLLCGFLYAAAVAFAPDARITGGGHSAYLKPADAAKLLKFRKEKFYYDIYWIGIYVGRAELEGVNDNGLVRITSEAHSGEFLSNFYKVEDFAESRVKDGVPLSFRIRQHEGRYRSDKETKFDARNGKITYFDYRKGLKEEHEGKSGVFWDVISGFYFLRTRGMEPDKTIFINIFDSNKFLNAEVSVLGREKVNFQGKGEIEAIVVKPILKSDGLFQNKGDIRIWLSNDANRFPLKVETKVPIGKVVAELKKVETEK